MTEKIGAVKNPMTIIAIFAGIAEVSGTIVLPFIKEANQELFIYFLMGFPTILVIVFFITLNWNNKALYAPSDYKDEGHYIKIFRYDLSAQKQVEVSLTPEQVFQQVNKNIEVLKESVEHKFHSMEDRIDLLTENDMGVINTPTQREFDEVIYLNRLPDLNELKHGFSEAGFRTQVYDPGDKRVIETNEDNKLIWINPGTSLDMIKQVIAIAKEICPFLEYIGFYSTRLAEPEDLGIFIGGSTSVAKERNMPRLKAKDFKKIQTFNTLEEFKEFIINPY